MVESIVFRPKISVKIRINITARILWKLLRVDWHILPVVIWLTVWLIVWLS